METSKGGVCQSLRNLIPPLHNLNCVSEVVSLDDPESETSKDDSFLSHSLGPCSGSWAYSSRLIPWLRKNLSNFDAVVIHGLWQSLSFAVTHVVRERKRLGKSVPKVFVMPHGMLDPWFQRDPSRRIKAIRNWLFWKAIENRVIANADALLFTCQRELELARETFRPYRPRLEIVVGLGVAPTPERTDDMQTAFFNQLPSITGRPYLLFLSRIHPKKGVDLLLNAYANIIQSQRHQVFEPKSLAAHSDSKFNLKSNQFELVVGRQANGMSDNEASVGSSTMGNPIRIPDLVIAGPIDSEYARQMMQLADDLGVSKHVHFPGMLLGDAKWGAFYGCEAFILPSHQENFGIAVAEALACGKPVLISNQVNIWHEIHSACAAFVAPDTAEGTYRVLCQWIDLDESSRTKMSCAARKCYERHFEIQASAIRMGAALGNAVDLSIGLRI
jgi:glycosyltransferase involved in cell wall biosynthesis